MLGRIDFSAIRFADPEYLYLLAVPGMLLLLWLWRLVKRQQDATELRRHRSLPVRERFSVFGGLLFWLSTTLALALLIVAIARPQAPVAVVRTAGADIVVLQDGSASMYTPDVRGDRWQRSMAFLRILGESMRWKEDRLAMTAFAHIAAPQIRLTKDPNTFLFFLDHLGRESPFRLVDDTTWDTNLELGLTWGLRLIDKDEELHGRSPNAKVFVLISDGQVWSGALAAPLQIAAARNIPLFVVGVGTTTGGVIPPPKVDPSAPPVVLAPYVPIHAALDRAGLSAMAGMGGGQYFELDRDSDRDVANRIVEMARQRAGSKGLEQSVDELYWRCLAAAAALLALGVLTQVEQAELWIQLAGAAAAMIVVWTVAG